MTVFLHACFLFVAGTGAAVLRAGLVELPRQVEYESAAGGIAGGEVAIAEDDGLGLIGVKEVDATQVGSQSAQAAERDVFLNTEIADDTGLRDAEIVVLALCGPLQVGTQSESVGQFDGIAPRTIEPRLREGNNLTYGSGRFVILKHSYN